MIFWGHQLANHLVWFKHCNRALWHPRVLSHGGISKFYGGLNSRLVSLCEPASELDIYMFAEKYSLKWALHDIIFYRFVRSSEYVHTSQYVWFALSRILLTDSLCRMMASKLIYKAGV